MNRISWEGSVSRNEASLEAVVERISKELDRFGLRSVDEKRSEPLERTAIQQPADLAPLIEHTLLKPDATRTQIKRLCEDANRYGFAGVCVNPSMVQEAKANLQPGHLVVAVVGFPLGANLVASKVEEAAAVLERGASEIDMVIDVGALKEREYAKVHEDIAAVVNHVGPTPVKVIIEAGLLSQEEKVAACLIAERSGARFLKTSTGFAYVKDSTGCYVVLGATLSDIQLMAQVTRGRLGVKAAGGIRDFPAALALVRAGATRIGSSSSVAIVTAAESSLVHGHE